LRRHEVEEREKDVDASTKAVGLLKCAVLLVGVHSITLGIFIYWFTATFYRLFFHVDVENIFFVRQSGIFLFLAGLFYLFPLFDIHKFNRIILLVVISKVSAVIFLITNAKETMTPIMIYLAAAGDATMAIALAAVYAVCIYKRAV
jgi:hypothetical protein